MPSLFHLFSTCDQFEKKIETKCKLFKKPHKDIFLGSLMSFMNIIRECVRQSNAPIETQNFVIANSLKIHQKEKREKRKMENSMMNEYEKKEKKQKTRELNELKKEKQLEWKESHKDEIQSYNKNYYENNKEVIKQRKKEQYNARTAKKEN